MAVQPTNFTLAALLAGASAGLAVDVTLFPLDTIKTRLQSKDGFIKSGGFRQIYSGLGSAALGSAPGAAIFFVSYETSKRLLGPKFTPDTQFGAHMIAAAFAEIVACIVRVPVEVVKQRAQANRNMTSIRALKLTLTQESLLGLYRGYFSTVFREVPFSLVQFPLWELLMEHLANRKGERRKIEFWEASLCGAIAGGVSAALTTPLDVAKTRIMLAERNSTLAQGNVATALKQVWMEKGFKGLFAGLAPRVMWISMGGAIFLGVYDQMKYFVQSVLVEN